MEKADNKNSTPNKKPKTKRVFTVLSIDGGGVRGIIPARILVEIEKRTGKPISETFDMISGTSTGGIIAASLTVPSKTNPKKPQFSARDVLSFYYAASPKVFPASKFKSIKKFINGSAYDPKPLEDELEIEFGEVKMSDALVSLMIPATDIKNFRPVWISHVKGEKDNSKEGWSSMLMRDAVRATTSAPTYFPAKYVETTPNPLTPHIKHRHALIDGTFFSGNTMRHLMTEARKIAPPDAEIVVVHIGTGETQHNLSPEEYNDLGPIGMLNSGNKGSLLLSLISSMSTMDTVNDLEKELGDRMFCFNKHFDDDQPKEFPTRALDDSRKRNLRALEGIAEEIISENEESFNKLCAVLKSKEIAERQHIHSHSAYEKLVDKMTTSKDVKSLLRIHRKILRYNIDAATPGSDDLEIKKLAKQLTDYHKVEIERIYHSLLDEKQYVQQMKIIQAMQQAKKEITQPKEPKQEPANDHQKPTNSKNIPKKKNGGNKPF